MVRAWRDYIGLSRDNWPFPSIKAIDVKRAICRLMGHQWGRNLAIEELGLFIECARCGTMRAIGPYIVGREVDEEGRDYLVLGRRGGKVLSERRFQEEYLGIPEGRSSNEEPHSELHKADARQQSVFRAQCHCREVSR